MNRQTKDIITRQKICENIKQQKKGTVVSAIVFLPLLIIGTILTVACISALTYPRGVLEIVFFSFGILLGVFVYVLCGIIAYSTIKSAIELARNDHNDFLVVHTVLTSKREELVRHGKGTRLERVFYFMYNNSRYVITEWDRSAYAYSDEGDEFFLVLYHENGVPVFAYNKKIYEYSER